MNIKNSKKSQELKPSMILILIILLFIAYIILIPPETREEILGESNGTSNGSSSQSSVSSVLISRTPGEINRIDQDSIEHPMPMLYLYAKPEPKELFYLNAFSVERSFFSEESSTLGFHIENPEDVEQAYLTFNVKDSKGITTIILNNYTIYSDTLSLGSINPIPIRKEYLKENNVLYFRLSKPFIFSKNKLQVENLKIVANVLKKDMLNAKTTFMIYNNEFKNLESAKLYFTTSCDINQIGKLIIKLNNQIVHEGAPACNNLNVIEVSQSKILEGENTLEFSLDKGSIKIDGLKLVTKLKEPSYPLYYFQVSEEQKELLDSKDAILKLEFPDDLKERKLVINLNGIKIDIESHDRYYTYKVNSFLREGNNYLKIEPISDDLRIEHLEIALE